MAGTERRCRLRRYELTFILPPTLDEEQATSATEWVREGVISRGGEVQTLDLWGRRRLAYPIRKYEEGVYHVARIALDPEQAEVLDRTLRMNEQVLRHLIVSLD